MARRYGSSSLDEMAERMRQAGYEPWEIADEVEEFRQLLDEGDRAARRMRETGSFREGDIFDELRERASDRRAQTTQQAMVPAQTETHRAPEIEEAIRREKEIDMAENKGTTIHVPQTYGNRSSVSRYTRKSDGELRAAVTLPPGTIVPLSDGTTFDASYHQIRVSNSQLSTSKDGGYDIWLPTEHKDGQAAEVLLSKSTGHYENPDGATRAERGQWIVDETSEVRVPTEALKQAVDNPVRNRVSVSIPKQIAGRDNIRFFQTKQGKELAAMKLPPHTNLIDTAGQEHQSGFFELVVPADAVRTYKNDPGYYQVGFPRTNREGEAWEVRLTRSEGRYENPDATTPEERGQWIEEEQLEVIATPEALKSCMEAYRTDVREYAEAQGHAIGEPQKAKDERSASEAKETNIEMPSPRTQASTSRTIDEDAIVAGAAAGAIAMAKPTKDKTQSL